MAKKLIGKFIDINNQNTYYVKIGNDLSDPLYINDEDDGTLNQVCFSGTEPVYIENDMTDTFEHVYIRQATINLISNFDIREIVIAKNYTDIPVEIRKDNANNIPLNTTRDDTNSEIIFTGFVIPLTFNQSYTGVWNEFSVECVDKLGILDYIKFPPLLNGDYNYDTPRSFIDLCLNQCNFNSKIYTNLQYDYTENTTINPMIFVGESEDDWMTCKAVLNEIGKIYGCYYFQDADDVNIENILLYSTNNPTFISKDDYMSNDTNISISEAYNQVKATVDISTIDETFIDPFKNENFIATTKRGERVFSEIIYDNEDNKWDEFVKFARMVDRANTMTDYRNNNQWNNVQQTQDDKLEVYDTYCQIKENVMFSFPSPNYLEENLDVLNPSTTGGGNGISQTDAYKTLRWLYNHPGKGAFLSFGKTNNLLDQKNKIMPKVEDMNDMLLIQVNGARDPIPQDQDFWFYKVYSDKLPQIIDSNNPVCSFTMTNSNSLVPNDKSTTNYLVINGKILLNPIIPRTGPLGDWDIDESSPERIVLTNDGSAQNTYLKGTSNSVYNLELLWNQYWPNKGNSILIYNRDRIGYKHTVVNYGEDNDEKGKYFQNISWVNTPEYSISQPTYKSWPYNQYADTRSNLAMPEFQIKYENYKFKCSGYDNDDDPELSDNVPRLPILACELKIGDKYLVEDFTYANKYQWKLPYGLYNDVYSWRTLEECPEVDGVKQTWFTISIDPGIDDSILGKEFDFADTVDISMNIDATGMAIPIPYGVGLNGPVEFKILGPYNTVWNAEDMKFNVTWVFQGAATATYPDLQLKQRSILAFIENIQISDLSIKLYSDNGGTTPGSQDNDLVYCSENNDEYIDEQEFDLKFCTSLTSQEAHDLNIDYKPNNSSILDLNGNRWTGMPIYKNYTDVKLEEARVNEQYNLWRRPRNIVETTIKLTSPEKAYLKTNYRFNYFKYSNNSYQVYRILGREIDLKMNTMTCTMKEISEQPV